MKTHPMTGDLTPGDIDLVDVLKNLKASKEPLINTHRDSIIVGLVQKK